MHICICVNVLVKKSNQIRGEHHFTATLFIGGCEKYIINKSALQYAHSVFISSSPRWTLSHKKNIFLKYWKMENVNHTRLWVLSKENIENDKLKWNKRVGERKCCILNWKVNYSTTSGNIRCTWHYKVLLVKVNIVFSGWVCICRWLPDRWSLFSFAYQRTAHTDIFLQCLCWRCPFSHYFAASSPCHSVFDGTDIWTEVYVCRWSLIRPLLTTICDLWGGADVCL